MADHLKRKTEKDSTMLHHDKSQRFWMKFEFCNFFKEDGEIESQVLWKVIIVSKSNQYFKLSSFFEIYIFFYYLII